MVLTYATVAMMATLLAANARSVGVSAVNAPPSQGHPLYRENLRGRDHRIEQ